MSILPPEVRAGYVYNRVLRAIGDRPEDEDRFPDGIPAKGTVTFTPKNSVKQVVSNDTGVTVTREPVVCTIHQGEAQYDDPDPDKAGLLIDEAGQDGGVWLVVGEWTVSYQFDDRYSNVPNQDIVVTEDHTEDNPLDVALVAGLTPSPTIKFVVNEQVYVDTLAARDETLQALDRSLEDFGETLNTEISTEGTLAHSTIAAQIEERAVTGAGVNRIIASTDPFYPIEPGELLVLLKDPRPQYFVDFSTFPEGVGVPSGWSQPWAESSDWYVAPDPVMGNTLRTTQGSSGSRRFLSLDAAADDALQYSTQEVVFRWRGRGDCRAVLRGGGSVGDEIGYWTGRNVQSVSVGRYSPTGSGSFMHDMPNPSEGIHSDVWYITRTRVEGDLLQSRTWFADQPEPQEWMSEARNSDVPGPGLVGLLDPLTHPTEFSYFGVGFDGARAPKGPLV